MNLACSSSNTRLTHRRFLFVVLPEYLVCLNRSLHLGGKPSHQRKPATPASLSYIQPLMSCKSGSTLSSSASRFLRSLWRWMTNPPRLYILAWSTWKMSPQTQTEGVSGTSQSYLSFTASRNSLSFKSKSLSLIGNTVSQLNAPFWVAIKSHSS